MNKNYPDCLQCLMEQPVYIYMHLDWSNEGGFTHNQYFQFSPVYFATVLNIINDILHTFRGKKVNKEPEG